jgi:hypothetical protein
MMWDEFIEKALLIADVMNVCEMIQPLAYWIVTGDLEIRKPSKEVLPSATKVVSLMIHELPFFTMMGESMMIKVSRAVVLKFPFMMVHELFLSAIKGELSRRNAWANFAVMFVSMTSQILSLCKVIGERST